MTRGLALALLALLALGACREEFAGRAVEPARAAPDVGALRIADQRGKVLLLTFGFTYCPDVCPATLSQLKAALNALGDDAARVAVAFVTVDPERDSPDELCAYVARFDPRILPVYVEPGALKVTLDGYGVTAERRYAPGAPRQGGGYSVEHTAGLFLVDKQGDSLLPTGDMDIKVEEFARIACALLDIPVQGKLTESLHTLFTLFSEFKNNQHFQS